MSAMAQSGHSGRRIGCPLFGEEWTPSFVSTRYGSGKAPLTEAAKYIDLKYYEDAKRG